MSRKIVPLVLLLFAVLLLILSFSLNGVIEKNRARIQEDLERSLGRAVTFGELKVSLWAGPGIAASDLKVAEDASFAATPFLQAKQVRMQLRWLPLLAGRLRIEKFILEEPEIQIIKNEAGLLNIAVLAGARDKKSKPHEETTNAPPREKKTAATPRLLITDIQVRNGNVDYIDRTGREPVEVRLRRLNLSASGAVNSPASVKLTGEIFEGQGRNLAIDGEAGPLSGRPWTQAPLRLKIRCDSLLLAQLAHAVPPLRQLLSGYVEASGPIAFEARVEGSIERPRFVDLDMSGPFFGSTANNAALKGDLDFSRAESREDGTVKLRLTVDPLPLDQLKTAPFFAQTLPPSLLMQGPISLSADLEGTLAALRVRAAVKAGQSEIVYGDWFKKTKGTAADLALDLERRKEGMVFRDSTLSLDNAKIKFSGALEQTSERRLLLDLAAEALALASLEKLLLPFAGYNLAGSLSARLSVAKSLDSAAAPEIRGVATLDNVQAKERRSGRSIERAAGQITFRGREARLDRLTLRSGASDVAVEGAVADIANPALRFSLRSAKLRPGDLNAATFSKSDELRSFAGSGELAIRNGKPWLRANVASAEGTVADFPYRNLRGEITWTPAALDFKNLALQTLGGNVRATGSWDAADGKALRLALEPNIEGLDLKLLSKQKMLGLENYFDGRFFLKGKFRAAGKNASAIPQGLAGAGETHIQTGALKTFNLLRLVLARSLGAQRTWPQRFVALAERKDTPFETLGATFTIQDGRAYSKNLILSAAEYSIAGEGSVGLDKSLQWQALLTLSPDFTQEIVQNHAGSRALVDRNGRLSMPFQVGGTLAHVQVKSDAPASR